MRIAFHADDEFGDGALYHFLDKHLGADGCHAVGDFLHLSRRLQVKCHATCLSFVSDGCGGGFHHHRETQLGGGLARFGNFADYTFWHGEAVLGEQGFALELREQSNIRHPGGGRDLAFFKRWSWWLSWNQALAGMTKWGRGVACPVLANESCGFQCRQCIIKAHHWGDAIGGELRHHLARHVFRKAGQHHGTGLIGFGGDSEGAGSLQPSGGISGRQSRRIEDQYATVEATGKRRSESGGELCLIIPNEGVVVERVVDRDKFIERGLDPWLGFFIERWEGNVATHRHVGDQCRLAARTRMRH